MTTWLLTCPVCGPIYLRQPERPIWCPENPLHGACTVEEAPRPPETARQ